MADNTKFTERPDTLYYCLQTLVRQRYENFDILVSDNFSQDNTEQVVRRIGDALSQYMAEPQAESRVRAFRCSPQ
jgi:glycosyltransferase involved in cell wall biosynthesis